MVSRFLGFLVSLFLVFSFLGSWLLGLSVSWFLDFVVSQFLSLLLSLFLGFKVSKIKKVRAYFHEISISCFLEEIDPMFKIFKMIKRLFGISGPRFPAFSFLILQI